MIAARGRLSLLAAGAAALFALPLLWMVYTSVRPAGAVLDPDAPILSGGPAGVLGQAAANYGAVLRDPVVEFPVYLRNTLLVALLAVAGGTVSSAVVAYGFARVRWPGRDAVFLLVLATMMLPFPVLMVPQYELFRGLGWIGTFRPLWVPACFGHAFSIFLLRQFYRRVPDALDDAARLDGCGHAGIFRHVLLPMSLPALAAAALVHFLFVWNDFIAPLVFITDRDDYTLALGLDLYRSRQGHTPWNLLMAASTLFILPVLAVFLLARSAIMGSVGAGARD